jgi:thymidylate synthase
MNNLDKQYTDLLQDILDNGIQKGDRTGTGSISVFGRQIRHKMSEGFPLLTTKKMAWKSVVTELLWFLRGDTNIKFLVDNGCNVWNGDAYKNYEKWWKSYSPGGAPIPLSREMFIERIKTDDEFAKKWGELGPIYGKQWRSWGSSFIDDLGDVYTNEVDYDIQNGRLPYDSSNRKFVIDTIKKHNPRIDQIANLINELKTNPDSRRLMVNAWNVGELDQMVLPPCHYGFQVYTRELSLDERLPLYKRNIVDEYGEVKSHDELTTTDLNKINIPTRAISLMWNQRSVDTPLGLPFNIASYGLLLEIIAKVVNMVPDELIGNLGDTHIYLNQIEGVKEQIGREKTWEELTQWVMKNTDVELENVYIVEEVYKETTPKRTREPFKLPKLNINTEFWPTESGECSVGNISVDGFIKGLNDNNFIRCLLEEDIQLSNYQSHPAIKMPLSN